MLSEDADNGYAMVYSMFVCATIWHVDPKPVFDVGATHFEDPRYDCDIIQPERIFVGAIKKMHVRMLHVIISHENQKGIYDYESRLVSGVDGEHRAA